MRHNEGPEKRLTIDEQLRCFKGGGGNVPLPKPLAPPRKAEGSLLTFGLSRNRRARQNTQSNLLGDTTKSLGSLLGGTNEGE